MVTAKSMYYEHFRFRGCIYNWLNAEDPLACKKSDPQDSCCFDYDAFKQHVGDFPDATDGARQPFWCIEALYLVYAEEA